MISRRARPIVYVHNSVLPAEMAGTVNVAKSCAAFAAAGHPVTLVHFRRTGLIEAHYGLADRFKILSLPIDGRTPLAIRVLAWTAAIVGRLKGAIVYGREPVFVAPAARLGCPVAVELHKELPEGSQNRAAFATLLQTPRLRSIICISKALADDIERQWPAAASRLFVAHDAADVQPLSPAPPRSSGSRPLLGYAGHLYPGKGMETIAALAKARRDWDFLVLGGRKEDVETWRKRTSALDTITYTGMLPHSEVADRLAGCDVLLAPYSRAVIVSDGRSDVARWMSPLKLFEYMALAKPVVVSDLPVIREVVRDGDNARLAEPDNPEDWERVIAELLADRESAAEMGERARSEVEKRFSWRARARAIADRIEQGSGT
jgi:glycosyltransferase involved in cell wall biosynthesis